ncbi:hypothetical protein ILUMI_05924 [Ignelater luminosus]|uniref:Uncharacterized protein n=1 Tax=Ignelater luminosus TaxID=2038154 RepID=A0A8K0D6E7_IGNLU|nr:hypothetical protein ILUMI_05924 [Ignelater luminosus]
MRTIRKEDKEGYRRIITVVCKRLGSRSFSSKIGGGLVKLRISKKVFTSICGVTNRRIERIAQHQTSNIPPHEDNNEISMEGPFEETRTSTDEDYMLESDENRQTNLNLHEVVDSEASVSELTDSETIAQPSTSCGNASQQGKRGFDKKESWKRRNNLEDDCVDFENWPIHIKTAEVARLRYKEHAYKDPEEGKVTFSVDLKKVIMLPRCEMFKSVIFAQLKNKKLKPTAAMCHEAIQGRKKEDIISAVQEANSGKVNILEMELHDFCDWKDFSSMHKINCNHSERPYLPDMVQVQAQRGSMSLLFTQPEIPLAKQKDKPRGITSERRDNITSKLLESDNCIMPRNRLNFSKEIPVNQTIEEDNDD